MEAGGLDLAGRYDTFCAAAGDGAEAFCDFVFAGARGRGAFLLGSTTSFA